MYWPNLKSVAFPVPEIIWGTRKNWAVRPRFLFSKIFHGLLFGWNKSPLKILEKRERMRIHFQGLPHFFGYLRLSQEWVKLQNSNFACTFIDSVGTKPVKNTGKAAVGLVRDSRKFLGHPYIRRIARSSLQ